MVSETKMIMVSLKLMHWDELPLHVLQVEFATMVQRGVEL